MILPTKHTNLSESILGLSGYLLTFLKVRPYSVDELWAKLEAIKQKGNVQYSKHTFDNLVLAIDLLFMIGAISMDNNDNIYIL